MRYARIIVSFDSLREALHLPWLTEIKHVRMADGSCWDCAELTISHPDLKDKPALAEGERPPIVTPTFRKQEPVEFVDWGEQR